MKTGLIILFIVAFGMVASIAVNSWPNHEVDDVYTYDRCCAADSDRIPQRPTNR
jgi:hypothetical protein